MRKKHATITLINPPSLSVDNDRLEPPLGLLYLAGMLRQNSLGDPLIYDMSGCATVEEINTKIERLPRSDIYGISCLCTNHEYAKHAIAHIRRVTPSAYVLIGGPNPSALPDFSLKDTGADAVVIGEGEDAFIHCVRSYLSGTPRKGVIRSTSGREIDSLPFPARDLVKMSSYSRQLQGEPVLSMIASRGCPHKCIFCNSVVMKTGIQRVRYRTPENVAGEIESLRGSYRNYRFNDDCFTANPKLFELLERIIALDICFRIFARVEDLTPQTCRKLKESGCLHVAVGLESLNPENLKLVGKGEQIGHEQNLRAAKEEGLMVRAYFMVGLPCDNEANIEHYFAKAAALGIDEFTVYPLIPYPGTLIAQNPERFGYTIINTNFREYIQIGSRKKTCYALRHKNFGPEEVERWHLRAEQILVGAGAKHSYQSVVAQ